MDINTMENTVITTLTSSQVLHISVNTPGEKTFIYWVQTVSDITLDVSFDFKYPDTHANIYFLIHAKKNARVTLSTRQNHVTSKITSSVFVRSVLDDYGMLFFHGVVFIDKGLHDVVGNQRSDVLTLSSQTSVMVKPYLEICSHDVKSSHATTVGTIPNEILLYMKSRGIFERVAKNMYAKGFLTHDLPVIADKLLSTKGEKKECMVE